MTRLSRIPAISRSLLLLAAILTMTSVTVAALSQGYTTNDTELKPGMLVMVGEPGSASSQLAERGTPEGAHRIIGVSTNPNQTSATIATASQNVYVESNGEVQLFVSDIQGAVHKGDLLTISPLKGIAAKADENSSVIVGTAADDFTNTKDFQSYVAKNSDGTTVSTLVGKMAVNIDSLGKSWAALRGDETSLQKFGRSLVGKQVSEIRVIIALIIFLLVLVAEGSILYGAISTSIRSIGRNPLARKFILRELFRVVVVAIFVLIIGLAAVYAILVA